MSIDWFTFAAQIVNFLILIWLLRRFLYRPVMRAMTEREAQIARQFADAEAAQESADAVQRDYEQKHQELAQVKETMLAKAGQDVEAWREEQLRHARADLDGDRRKWYEELAREKQTLLRELQLDVTQHAVELGRRLLEELADQSLQSRLTDRFIGRLHEVDLSTLKGSGSAVAAPLVVESSHELTESDRSRIVDVLQDLGSDVRFQQNPQLICGIELQTPGCRFAWNLRESLAEVESDLIDAIEETLPGAAEAASDIGRPASSEAVTP